MIRREPGLVRLHTVMTQSNARDRENTRLHLGGTSTFTPRPPHQFGVGPGFAPDPGATASCNFTAASTPRSRQLRRTLQSAANGAPPRCSRARLTGSRRVLFALSRTFSTAESSITRRWPSRFLSNAGSLRPGRPYRIDLPDPSAFRLGTALHGPNDLAWRTALFCALRAPIGTGYTPLHRARALRLHVASPRRRRKRADPDTVPARFAMSPVLRTATVTARSMATAPSTDRRVLSRWRRSDIRIVRTVRSCGACFPPSMPIPFATPPHRGAAGPAYLWHDPPPSRGTARACPGRHADPASPQKRCGVQRKAHCSDRTRPVSSAGAVHGAPSCTATFRSRFTVRPRSATQYVWDPARKDHGPESSR